MLLHNNSLRFLAPMHLPRCRVEERRGVAIAIRLPSHRVTGGGRPPPVPTERGVRISRTNALRQLVHSTASACSSR
jgi:hypothetical protein